MFIIWGVSIRGKGLHRQIYPKNEQFNGDFLFFDVFRIFFHPVSGISGKPTTWERRSSPKPGFETCRAHRWSRPQCPALDFPSRSGLIIGVKHSVKYDMVYCSNPKKDGKGSTYHYLSKVWFLCNSRIPRTGYLFNLFILPVFGAI